MALKNAQDIGLVECANHTIVGMTKTTIEAQKLDKSFWAEIVIMQFIHSTDVQQRSCCLLQLNEVEWEETLYCTHACLQKHCICNGSG